MPICQSVEMEQLRLSNSTDMNNVKHSVCQKATTAGSSILLAAFQITCRRVSLALSFHPKWYRMEGASVEPTAN